MDQETIIETIRDALAERGVSRGWLANEAGVSESTLDKHLSGNRPISRDHLRKYEVALDVPLRAVPQIISVAPERLGGYSRTQAEWLAGEYVGVRRARKTRQAYVAFHAEIEWDDGEGCLAFRTSAIKGAPYELVGKVSLTSPGTQIQLVSERMGEFELINLKRPDASRILRGIHLLTDDDGGHYVPTARKIAFAPLEVMDEWLEVDFGVVRAGDARHGEIAEVLEPRLPDDFLE